MTKSKLRPYPGAQAKFTKERPRLLWSAKTATYIVVPASSKGVMPSFLGGDWVFLEPTPAAELKPGEAPRKPRRPKTRKKSVR